MQWFDAILQFDSHLFLQLNGSNSAFWDVVMAFFTRKETWLAFYLVLIAVVIRNYRNKAWVILFFLLLGFIFSDQISSLIKELVQRLRPGYEPAIENLTHIVLKKGGLYGFVSSHASNTFFVLTFTSLLFRNHLSFMAILVWTLMVSYSRIYVGAHYPLDIFGGWLLGFASGFAFYKALMFAESRFFVARSPNLNKTSLSAGNAGLLLLTVSILVLTLLISVHLLFKYKFL